MKIQHLNEKNEPIDLDVTPVVLLQDLKDYEDLETKVIEAKGNPSAYVEKRQEWVAKVLKQSHVDGTLRMTAAQVNQAWYNLYWGNVKAVNGAGHPFG